MREFSRDEVIGKIRATNAWWGNHQSGGPLETIPFRQLKEREYFWHFKKLATQREPVRAVVLMGPRRVGKTVMLFHLIKLLISDGVPPERICYLDIQQPLYSGFALEQLLNLAREAAALHETKDCYLFFDEIQYLRNWEVHLKALVDAHPEIKFVATGSAAAALKLKSNESGAGRFTDFILPPLTFFEYLSLLNKGGLVQVSSNSVDTDVSTENIAEVNKQFVDYLNCGGYPEAVFSDEVKSDLQRYIRSDIIDKVLLKDLPSLYGIQDIRELNSLFTSLAYNTAHEVSLGELSKNSGVAKNTIKRYIEYLESAFLIRTVHRIDHSAKKFQRANFFKVYLTNPSIRSALFSPVAESDEDMGSIVETAVFAQWFHSRFADLHYARWNGGEVDIVQLGWNLKPAWVTEVKWSDRCESNPNSLHGLREFLGRHPQCSAVVTTKTVQSKAVIDGHHIEFIPASLYCYVLGYNINRFQAIDATRNDWRRESAKD